MVQWHRYFGQKFMTLMQIENSIQSERWKHRADTKSDHADLAIHSLNSHSSH